MEKTLQRILVTFTVGFLLTGAILGFVGVADCGSVFAPKDGCAATLTTERALVIAFIGLGLTAMAAAILTETSSESTESSESSESESDPQD